MCVFVIWDLDLGSLSDHAVTNGPDPLLHAACVSRGRSKYILMFP